MKSYTDLEQSKKLAEILPLESADMKYYIQQYEDFDTGEVVNNYTLITCSGYFELDDSSYMTILPAWSLAALLSVLPIIGEGKNTANPFIAKTPRGEYYVVYATLFKEIDSSDIYSNPIDACYEMIIKLHEQNLL